MYESIKRFYRVGTAPFIMAGLITLFAYFGWISFWANAFSSFITEAFFLFIFCCCCNYLKSRNKRKKENIDQELINDLKETIKYTKDQISDTDNPEIKKQLENELQLLYRDLADADKKRRQEFKEQSKKLSETAQEADMYTTSAKADFRKVLDNFSPEPEEN